MARAPRNTPAGLVYHVLNRSAGRFHLFRREADFLAFERLLVEAHARHPIRILSYCVMSNHWHFVVWPERDGDVTAFFKWLTNTHAVRWRVAHRTVGYGAIYQGRFKSFPIQRDQHLLTACRYVERNALSAGAVKHAQDWRFSSLWARTSGADELRGVLSAWPLELPANWTALVNRPIFQKELERYELSMKRGRPFGDDAWVEKTARRLDLTQTLRDVGRPKKTEAPH